MSSSTPKIEWPTEVANRVLFEIPNDWKYVVPRSKKGEAPLDACKLCYDETEGILEIVAVSAAASSSPSSTESNEEDKTKPEEKTSIAVLHGFDPYDMIGVEVKQPLLNDTNEESSSMDFSTLTFFCYPRVDYNQMSRLVWCGVTSAYIVTPNPKFRSVKQQQQENNSLGHRIACPLSLTLRKTTTDEATADIDKLVRVLQQLANGRSQEQQKQEQRFLVVVNPMSGNKKGTQIAKEVVVPMLKQSNVATIDVFVTERAGHALDAMSQQNGISIPLLVEEKEKKEETEEKKDEAEEKKEETTAVDLSEYSAVIIVGGDGTLHEVVNGIVKRQNGNDLLQNSLTLGVVGCGAGNGYAKSITFASGESHNSSVEQTFLIAKQQTALADRSTYQTSAGQGNGEAKDGDDDKKKGINVYTSVLTFTWAMVADIDMESEKINWLVGGARFDVWAVWRILSLRRYRAKFSYLPATAVKHLPLDDDGNMLSVQDIIPKTVNDPLPKDASDWITMDDDFVLFWASHVTHAGETAMNSPDCNFGEGFFRIWLIRYNNISRLQLAKMLLVLETGGHKDHPASEFIDCVAYRLEPMSGGSYFDVDGEPVMMLQDLQQQSIQAHVQPRSMRIFCNPKAKKVTPKVAAEPSKTNEKIAQQVDDAEETVVSAGDREVEEDLKKEAAKF